MLEDTDYEAGDEEDELAEEGQNEAILSSEVVSLGHIYNFAMVFKTYNLYFTEPFYRHHNKTLEL